MQFDIYKYLPALADTVPQRKFWVMSLLSKITKNDKITVKKSLTKTNNVSKSNKEPSIKIIPGDVNKPKIISDGKEWNIEE